MGEGRGAATFWCRSCTFNVEDLDLILLEFGESDPVPLPLPARLADSRPVTVVLLLLVDVLAIMAGRVTSSCGTANELDVRLGGADADAVLPVEAIVDLRFP